MKENILKLEIKKKRINLIIIIFILSVIFPRMLGHEALGIFESIEKALEFNDKEYLLEASIKLVFLNTARLFLLYTFMLLLADSFEIRYEQNLKKSLKIGIIALVIPITYSLIMYLHGIKLMIGKTSFFSILWFIYYIKLDLSKIKIGPKILIFTFFILGIQWFDISPFLMFFGVGEITYHLNQVVEFMNATNFYIIICMSYFIFFISISLMLLYFFRWEEEVKEKNASEIENRYLKEMQLLVHDLKTPIFAISGLIEILIMEESDGRKLKYLEKIEVSLQNLEEMTEEILGKNIDKQFKLVNMMNFIFAILSTHKKSNNINYENYSPKNSKIEGNRVLLGRALINIIINSWEAKSEKIDIRIKKYGKTYVFQIEDYGQGLKGQSLEALKAEGYSTKNSTGKGLAFVDKVIKKYKGQFYMIEKNQGVKTFIVIKERK